MRIVHLVERILADRIHSYKRLFHKKKIKDKKKPLFSRFVTIVVSAARKPKRFLSAERPPATLTLPFPMSHC